MTNDFVDDDNQPVTRTELISVCEDTETILAEMKAVINVHAEVLACHRYVLERFVPGPLFQKAVKDYYEARAKEIDLIEKEAEIETDPDKLN